MSPSDSSTEFDLPIPYNATQPEQPTVPLEPAASQAVAPTDPLPVFHNPLAAAHDQQVGALPPLPTVADVPLAPQDSPAVTPPPIQTISEIQDDVSKFHAPPVIQAAPVRLAPEPRSDAEHARQLAASAQATPFGAVHNAAAPINPARPIAAADVLHKKRSSLAWVMVGVVALAIILISLVVVAKLRSKPVATNSTPAPAQSKRDTKGKALGAGMTAVQTDCYILQIPTQPEIQLNKDCSLSVAYGEQKVSSIVVSPFRDFDLVTSSENGSQNNPTQGFDSQKILDGLIASTTTGKVIAERSSIKVGNIDAVKITSSATSGGSPVVAYIFIVLPATDQKFNEKSFIAFIVTGAYNDDYSRTNYDLVLKNWQWQ